MEFFLSFQIFFLHLYATLVCVYIYIYIFVEDINAGVL
jgi:hypothetical protein